tara:strand:+ start:24768 stop:25565 length:798 start_codon:yes stop_codon:yes gene_type:complete
VTNIEIRPLGSFQLVNADGFVNPIDTSTKIPMAWLKLVEHVTNFYASNLNQDLHSVYIRGSIAKGEPVDFISDMDSFAITMTENSIDEVVLEEFQRQCESKFPFCKGIEIMSCCINKTKTVEPKRERSILEELIKTQSRCVLGTDLSPTISPFTLPQMIGHSLYIVDEIDKKLPLYLEEDKDSKQDIKNLCGWIMRRLIRACYDRVMLQEGKFTRDLYLCAERVGFYRPSLKEDLRNALHFALNPSENVEEWMPLVHKLKCNFEE